MCFRKWKEVKVRTQEAKIFENDLKLKSKIKKHRILGKENLILHLIIVVGHDDVAVDVLSGHFVTVINSISAGTWCHYPDTKELKSNLKAKGLCLWKFKKEDVLTMTPRESVSSFMSTSAIRKKVEAIRQKVNLGVDV